MSAAKGTRPVRIANCSGFFGDRISAAREMIDPAVLDDSPIDVLTGDWLAELTKLILQKQRARNAEAGFAGTFLTQMEQVLGTCIERGIKVVTNAGGLNPSGCAQQVRDLGARLGLDVNVAHVEGDDLLDRIDGLRTQLTNLDTGAPFTATAVSANAYLGGWGIARALSAGADVVVCPRVTDAAVVVGPAAWWWDWAVDDWDALAGAVVAGHLIECGAQTTGGNYSWFSTIPEPAKPLGFPIAEIDRDGNTVITKHPGTGGIVDVGSVTAQLLYEIGPPAYLNPDVTTHFETVQISDDGADRVLLSGTCGSPAPPTAKVSINCEGGFRNRDDVRAHGARPTGQGRLGARAAVHPARWRGALRRGRHPLRPGTAGRDRPGGRLRAAARARQEHRRAARRSGVLLRRHRAGPGQLPGFLHHHPARSGAVLRHVLAGVGEQRRRPPRGGPRRWSTRDHPGPAHRRAANDRTRR